MATTIAWHELPALHRAGALSTYLKSSWEDASSKTLVFLSNRHAGWYEKDVLKCAQKRLDAKNAKFGWLWFWAALSSATFFCIALFDKSQTISYVSFGMFFIVAMAVFPQNIDTYSSHELSFAKRFAEDLSTLATNLGKTPAALAQLDERELKSLATRHLRLLAAEIAKFDGTLNWTAHQEAHDKMRNEFKKVFDLIKSFGLSEEEGYGSYFPTKSQAA